MRTVMDLRKARIKSEMEKLRQNEQEELKFSEGYQRSDKKQLKYDFNIS